MFALTKLRKTGDGLSLSNLHPAHMEVVMLATLEGVFGVFGTRQDAINSCFPDRLRKHYDILEFINAELTPASPKPAATVGPFNSFCAETPD